MDYLTKQEIFDKVAKHLLTQNKQCVSSQAGGCVYRNEDGLKCAIGVLIPDEAYSPEIEDITPDLVITMSNTKDRASAEIFCYCS